MYAPDPSPSALVGRDRERALLRERLAAAIAGTGSLVLIGGEAGIGKTALAEMVCREAAAQGALVLVGRCYDLTETPPYGPWVEAFGRYPHRDGDLPLPDAFSQRGTVGAVSSQAALLQQVLDFFAALAVHQPLVLLLDDMHWADSASLDALRVLARSVPTIALLIVVTYRSDEVKRQHPLSPLLPLLVRESGADRLDVRPFDTAIVRSLVDGRFRLPDVDADRLVTYLQGRAGGNALFVGELLRALEEDGVLRLDKDGWTLNPLTEAGVPALLRQVIDARVARLTDECQRLLSVAAIIGAAVSYDLWAAVAVVDEGTLLDIVTEAEAAHIMAESRDGSGAAFVHALLREAIYESVRPSQRRRWHRMIGEALITHPTADPDAVADHFRRAGDARAIVWLTKAGERAQQAWAWVTAQHRYDAALSVVGETDPGTRGELLFRLAMLSMYGDTSQAILYLDEALRVAVSVDDAPLAANALFMQGRLRCMMGEVRRGLAEMVAGMNALVALPLAGTASPVRDAMTEMLHVQTARGLLLSYLAVSGRHTEAHAVDAAIRATGRQLPYTAHRGLRAMHAALGQTADAEAAYRLARTALTESGDLLNAGLTALEHLHDTVLHYHAEDLLRREAIAAEADEAYQVTRGQDERLPPRRGRLPLLVLEGHWEEARTIAEAVLAVGGYGGYISNARSLLAPLAQAQGDTKRAWQLVREVLPAGAATVPGDVTWCLEALAMQRTAASLCLDSGDLAVTHEWLTAHTDWLEWSGIVLGLSESHLLWARYYLAAGETERADVHAQSALTTASEPRQPLTLIAAHRLLGELDTGTGRFDSASTHLEAALTLADACAAPYERALALLAMAELRAATGNRADALGLLDEVRAICTPLGAQPALARADALTTHLATMRDAPPSYPAGLSAREVEVIRLLAEGRSNKEIADTLFLSVHTVRVHVRNILTKTHTDNRAAATAFAFQHGIA